MTYKILQEIYFYEKVDPFRMLQENVFEGNRKLTQGHGRDEHVININLDISFKEFVYKDTFDWDIVNPSNM
jgi:hypothetical protein